MQSFGIANVLFVLYEDIADRPARLLDRIQDFIGVDRLPFARLQVGIVNSAKEVGPRIVPRNIGTPPRADAPFDEKVRRLDGAGSLALEDSTMQEVRRKRLPHFMQRLGLFPGDSNA